MFLQKMHTLTNLLRHQFEVVAFRYTYRSPQLALAAPSAQPSLWDDLSIWFAVPKRKHTRSRKRMKTTKQKRLKLKKNIIFDPRTGEVTLKHKMPFNWKDYLPNVESTSS